MKDFNNYEVSIQLSNEEGGWAYSVFLTVDEEDILLATGAGLRKKQAISLIRTILQEDIFAPGRG